MNPGQSAREEALTRRKFGHKTLIFVPFLYAAGLVTAAIAYLYRPLLGKKRLARLDVGSKEEFLAGKVERREFNDIVVYILAAGDTVLAKKAKCTHLGCNVHWEFNGREDHFGCPCHGQVFEKDGTPLPGLTRTPLADQPFEVTEDGRVVLLDDQEV